MLAAVILTMGISTSFSRTRPAAGTATDKASHDSRTLFDFTVKNWKGSIIFLYLFIWDGSLMVGVLGESVALNSYEGKKAFLVVNVASN